MIDSFSWCQRILLSKEVVSFLVFHVRCSFQDGNSDANCVLLVSRDRGTWGLIRGGGGLLMCLGSLDCFRCCLLCVWMLGHPISWEHKSPFKWCFGDRSLYGATESLSLILRDLS